jgi:tetratricopeptide (TPR) repeat protein
MYVSSHLDPAAELTQAIGHHKAGRLEAAEDGYRRALAADPRLPDALRLLGVVRYQRSDPTEAEDFLNQAVRSAPDNAKVHDNRGYVLSGLGRTEEAIAAFQQAVALEPKNPTFLFNLGNLLCSTERTNEAIAFLRRAVEAAPGHLTAHQQLGGELLKTGDADGARRHFDLCIENGQVNAAIVSHLMVALSELGEHKAVNSLTDFDRFVVPVEMTVMPGFASLRDFNAALARWIVASTTQHADQTTVNGVDTGELLAAPDPAIAILRDFVHGQIDRRQKMLPDASHLFARSAPKEWRTQSWGVRMWKQGYQVTHIHQKAWLSGVYYVQLPDSVQKHARDHEGWIEFGRGPDHLYRSSTPDVRLIQPREGLLLSFPSYLWHRTIPFTSEQERFSIAFDVIPVD